MHPMCSHLMVNKDGLCCDPKNQEANVSGHTDGHTSAHPDPLFIFFYLLIFYPFPLILRSLCFKNSPWPSHNTVEQNRNPITVFLFAQFEGEENRLAPMARGSGSLCQGAGWNQRIAVCDWHPWLFITLTAALCTYFFCRRGGCSVCWLRTSHDGAVAFHDICFWVTWGKWKPVFLQYPCTVWPSTWCAV